MFESMERVHYGCRMPGVREEVCRVNGDQFERFLLKVLCGALFSGNLGPASGSMKRMEPPFDWLKILFEGGAFPDGHGLYNIPAGPTEIIVADHDILQFTPFFTEDFTTVCGIRAWFFGVEFDLLLVNLPSGVRTSFDGALYRPAGLRVEGNNSRIDFAWESGPGSGEIVLRRI
jgi:hypothetical protein